MKALMWLGFVLGAVAATDKVITARAGQSVSLPCGPETWTRSLMWERENILITNIVSNGLPRKGSADVLPRSKIKEMNLEINPVRKQDAGKFTCTADSQSHVITLLVASVWASPSGELQAGSEAKLQCEVEGLPKNSAVQWKRLNGGQQTGSKEVHLNPVTLADQGTWVCKFTYNNEEYSENLDIKVKAATPTSAPIQSTKVLPKSLCPNCGTDPLSGVGKISWMVWLVVGVCSLVLIVLVVFVVVLSRRIRMRKRKRSGRQSLRAKKYCECNCPTAAAKPRQGRQKGKPSALPLRPLLME